MFNGDDTNQISLTLKNYKRPAGVATQINNVNLNGFINLMGNQSLKVDPNASASRFGQLKASLPNANNLNPRSIGMSQAFASINTANNAIESQRGPAFFPDQRSMNIS